MQIGTPEPSPIPLLLWGKGSAVAAHHESFLAGLLSFSLLDRLEHTVSPQVAGIQRLPMLSWQ